MEKFSPTVRETINKIIQEERFINHTVEVNKIGGNGASYQGVLHNVTIKGDTGNGDKVTNIFIKHLIENYENFKLYSVIEVYKREAFVYNELSKVFNELEEESNVPNEERHKIVKNYECSTEAIILDNINIRGFTTFPRMDVMPIKLAELSVEQLAKFHALTFILKIKRPEYFDSEIKTLEQCMVFDKTYEDFMRKMFDTSIEVLDEERKNKVADFFPTMLADFPKYVRGEKTTVKCLCHGDYRISNIMITKTDGNITDVLPIDYQQIYYGSPPIDLVYLIFSSSDRQFRKDHLNHLKDLYFETLEKFLKYFQVDVTTVYPKKEFEKDFETCLNYALIVSMYFMPFFYVLEDDSPDLNEELLELTLKLDPRFADRLSGIIDDFVEWGYLK